MSFLSYFFPKTILQTGSSINQSIRINEEHGKYKLLVNGARESGEYIEKIWTYAFSRFFPKTHAISSVLVLGIAGGTVIRMIHGMYPKAAITGVDIDPVMIEIGKKYFGLNEISGFTCICADAKRFMGKTKKQFDLVIVDVFVGPNVPDFVTTKEFQMDVWKRMTQNGIGIINYLELPDNGKKVRMLQTVLTETYTSVQIADISHSRFFMVKSGDHV